MSVDYETVVLIGIGVDEVDSKKTITKYNTDTGVPYDVEKTFTQYEIDSLVFSSEDEVTEAFPELVFMEDYLLLGLVIGNVNPCDSINFSEDEIGDQCDEFNSIMREAGVEVDGQLFVVHTVN